MPATIPITKDNGEPTRIFVADQLPYLKARAQADSFANTLGFVVASMPQLIHAMNDKEARQIIRLNRVDVVSVEYYGQINGDQVYAVAHGVGPFSDLDTLKEGWTGMNEDGFMLLRENEFRELLTTQPLYNVNDLKMGGQPEGDYVVASRWKDLRQQHQSGQLEENEFMNDDIVLMRTGSMEGRETLLRTLKNEGFRTFGNYYTDMSHSKLDVGRPLYIDGGDDGLAGDRIVRDVGRFIGIEPVLRTPQDKPLEKRI